MGQKPHNQAKKPPTILLENQFEIVIKIEKLQKTSPNRPHQKGGRAAGGSMKNNELRQQILKELLENEPLTSSIDRLNKQLDQAGKEELGRLMGIVYTYGYESCINDTLLEMQKINRS